MVRPVANPPNPWSSTHVAWVGEPPPATLEVFEEDARTVLSRNDSPDIPFRWSLNPYRGCMHACAYCYARPSHQYLGYGAGTDFDRKIVVKINAAARLREAFMARSWVGEEVMFSGNTDCYQPLEASYGLTRACLGVCLEFRNPVTMVTKGMLVRRDAALLAALAREADALVFVSIPFADDPPARAMEPWASSPSQRFETLRVLTDAGVPCGVAVAPVIPGLNDQDIPRVLTRARECGARWAFMTLLRLPREVLPVFNQRLTEAFPDRADHVRSAVREYRAGKVTDAAFGARMTGRGARWELTRDLFDLQCRRLGYEEHRPAVRAGTFLRPTRQGSLFTD